MEGLKNYREKLRAIEQLVDKMENGLLSINELVELESLTRDLYERSIILKYKAFEGKVEGESEPKIEVVVPVVEEEIIVEKVPEIKAKVEEEPVLDFSLFDENEEVEIADDVQPEVELFAPVEEKVEIPVVPVTPVAEVKPIIDEVKQESEVIPELSTEEPIVVVREKGSSFLDRLSILDNSISSQLAGRKIDTLSGAFGINERLLYINQLFDGSGEAFSDAIKVLDSQQNLDEASHKVEELAFANSWNPEEEVVLEFLAIIKRRYA